VSVVVNVRLDMDIPLGEDDDPNDMDAINDIVNNAVSEMDYHFGPEVTICGGIVHITDTEIEGRDEDSIALHDDKGWKRIET
jgi:hypothetical protein